MAEKDIIMKHKADNGDIETAYPVTKAGNVIGLSEALESISETVEENKDILDKNLDVPVSTRAPGNTALSNEVWTDDRAENLDLLENETYGLPALKTGIETATNNVSTILTAINELYASQNSVYVASNTATESHSSTITTISASASGALRTETRGRTLVKFVAKYSGTIAVKFTGRTYVLDTSVGSFETRTYSRVYGLMYKYANKTIVDTEIFNQTTLSSSSTTTPPIKNYDVTTLIGNSETITLAGAGTSATVNIPSTWTQVAVEKGDVIIFAVVGDGGTAWASATNASSTMTVSNMSVQLGYSLEVV